MLNWVKENKFYIGAYILFIVVFWFAKSPKMTAATAYFGLVALHLFFFLIVWVIKNVFKR